MNRDEIVNNRLELLGELFTDLMHEIRNPITVLKINCDLMSEEAEKDNKEIDEIVKSGREALGAMEKLISQTLDFIRGDEGNLETCSINNIAETAYDFMKQRARKKGIKFEKVLTEKELKIIANKSQIVQVVLNLLTNSFDAVKENPHVYLKTYCEDGSVCLEIFDNGHGINEEVGRKIYDRFFTTKESGAGIGLAVSKKILDRHKAEIKFESKVGEGTKFLIKFNNAEEITL